MTMRLSLALLALTVSAGAHAEPFEFRQSGTLKIDDAAARGATLRVVCSPDPDGGALSIELVVSEANTRKDFDYDDFEGPDAAAASKALSRLSWTSAAGPTEITIAAGGWYVPDPPEAFTFAVSQLSHHREPPAHLLLSVTGAAGVFAWTQTAFDASKRRLVATFDLDAAAAERLHTAAVRCLPINSPMNPGR
jgi:hypothetical protein